MADARPHRSVLYMPGSNARALEKAKSLDADALILDLEDAVAPDAKAAAREQVCEAVRSGGYGARLVTIRVNGLDTEWHADDIAAAAAARPAAVVVPKVSSPDDVTRVAAAVRAAGSDASVWAMIETPLAVVRVAQIAAVGPELGALVLGTNDLASELRVAHAPGRPALTGALSQCVLAARAYGRIVLDGVFNDVRDADGFAAECAQGRLLGFDGKTLIHPSQLAECNRAFSPSEADVAQARRVIDAFDAAQREGHGVATLDGRMIENMHVADARRVVTLATALHF